MSRFVVRAVASAWRWHIALFVPTSTSFRYWLRVTFLWFVPICTLHQLSMSAFFDAGGLSQRIVVSRIILAVAVGAAFSIIGWLGSNTLRAARKLI
ncbi:hypothetical protein [Luteibacter aegosomatissinici]|uniref:hypothetical protein n=1 Tax=Luteibacter aegosomatissinici TaxID=2911539 RepID=UPI001FF9293A|nr:hypothetical protein [Luteibacter aegosomatissinici]UPG93464.1 hypothetical protein L2Y97_16670 [Luteibacter aegosomatissinici]